MSPNQAKPLINPEIREGNLSARPITELREMVQPITELGMGHVVVVRPIREGKLLSQENRLASRFRFGGLFWGCLGCGFICLVLVLCG